MHVMEGIGLKGWML